MQLDKKKKNVIISSVIAILLLVIGSIVLINTKGAHEGEKGGQAKVGNGDTVKSDDSTGAGGSDGVFEKKLVDEKQLLVKSKLTWKQFGEKLSEADTEVSESFAKLFNDLKWNGVFFECKPIKPSTAASDTVEFRIIETNAFTKAVKNPSTYKSHFDAQCSKAAAAVFPNPDNTSMLVSPCPTAELEGTHVKVFMSSATLEQRNGLLKVVGKELLDQIGKGGDKAVWLSTSGLGVSWLHVRFDTKPKYYTTLEYKKTA